MHRINVAFLTPIHAHRTRRAPARKDDGMHWAPIEFNMKAHNGKKNRTNIIKRWLSERRNDKKSQLSYTITHTHTHTKQRTGQHTTHCIALRLRFGSDGVFFVIAVRNLDVLFTMDQQPSRFSFSLYLGEFEQPDPDMCLCVMRVSRNNNTPERLL